MYYHGYIIKILMDGVEVRLTQPNKVIKFIPYINLTIDDAVKKAEQYILFKRNY